MSALLAKYLAKPTQANAARVVAYRAKHPMATLCLNHLELGVLKQAEAHK